MSSNEQTLLYLKEIEDAADLVLTNKQEIVDLDRKRNSNREALSAFEKQMKWFNLSILFQFRFNDKLK